MNVAPTASASLPAHWYFEPGQYEQELARVWYRHWIYVGRSSELAGARTYNTFEVGTQRMVLVRDDQGQLRAFHNTCRHRGAALCAPGSGTLPSANLVCPYHAWVYNLQGGLMRTSSKRPPEGFDSSSYGLYPARVIEWNGFMFISLSDDPPPLIEGFDAPGDRLDHWPMRELVVAHASEKIMLCNWKIFWENYNECLHCPGVHPTLSALVPVFGKGLLDETDDPALQTRNGLRSGAVTFSKNGLATSPQFAALTAAQRRSGQIYVTSLPSMFIAAHVDYLRVVRVRPLSPETTELRIEYLLPPDALAAPGFDLNNIVDFADEIMSEDAQICEVNQRGLHALPHTAGVLMPEEYLLRDFHQWLRQQLG